MVESLAGASGSTRRPASRVVLVEGAGAGRDDLRASLEKALGKGAVVPVPLGGGLRRALATARPRVIVLEVEQGLSPLKRLQRVLQGSTALYRIPVIVVADRATPADRVRALARGAGDFVARPCDGREVAIRARNLARLHAQERRAERECRRLRSVERQHEDLLQMVAHDMGSPLFVIHCSVEVILSSPGMSEERRSRMLASVLQAARSLGAMLSDLRDVRRFVNDEMVLNAEEHDLGTLVRQALENVGVGVVEAEVVADVPRTPMPVLCDGPMVQRVVENLVARALRVSPQGGRVHVRLLPCSTGPIMRVSDQGPAIPPELHDRMFERFGQVELQREGKKCASALGLAFCKLAVDAHDGRIGVESEEGRGNTFWFTIPT